MINKKSKKKNKLTKNKQRSVKRKNKCINLVIILNYFVVP